MRMSQSTPVVAVTAVLALGATACGSESTENAEEGKVTVGMSVSTLNNPFFVQLKEGAQASADALGVDLDLADAQNDASRQANQVQNFVTKNTRSIIINPVDSDAAGPAVKAADQADIPVVAADRGVNDAEVGTTIASDNVQGGRLAANALAKALDGRGTVVVLRGIAGTSASQERGKGFTLGLRKYAGVKVVATQPADFDRAKGLDVMANLLQAHPDIDGVFAENDEMALGAVKALGRKAGQAVKVVGFDGTPDGLQAIERGSMVASIAQQPAELGEIAVRNAVRLARDEPVDKEIKVPVKVVTARDVATYR